MKYGTINFGQVEALLNKIGGEEVMQKILNGTATFQITEEQFLQSLGVITLDPIKVKKDEFFVTGENGTTKLWLSDNFKNIFLPLVADTIDYKGGKLEKLKLTKGRNDFQIKEERGDILIQTPDDIASQIASLTSKQPKGSEGDLLNNGYANIFYFEKGGNLFCVGVWWDSGSRKWECYCDQAYSGAWFAGRQVLSPVTQDSES